MNDFFCKYKDIFGIPKEGIHKQRIFGLAFWDLFFTLIASILISFFFKIHIIYSFIGLFILGILFHLLFCVKTAFITKYLNFIKI
jgi:hypothetical protein